MKLKRLIWPLVGLTTIAFSIWLLLGEVRGLSFDEIGDSLSRIGPISWLLAVLSTLLAYAALAGYDRIALQNIGRSVSWLFITVTSFTAYALSHNVGASVFSGAVVRYRAYSSRGLTGAEVGSLVAICSFTFMLGTVFLMGMVLVLQPDITERFVDVLPVAASRTTGVVLLALVGLYALGSLLRLRPLRIRSFVLAYPRPVLVIQQLIIGPLELIGAAGIIYFALPDVGNPGFLVVLGIFLVSFSAALISHAPGGLGVLELLFVTSMPDVDPADVIAALLVFRLFYLIIPFALALVVILLFERSQLSQADPPAA
ncbi:MULTISPECIES: lysylphosphatidylglycerol synthase domain-containing protein [Rhizobium]|uniref:Uncharacterized protein n=1 Tax=Rhizobium wuzhouense TaxID=1986026 RepID=A0ABX5NR70_9HYPH|nr:MULTISPECIES: lysylphosphatidylglycerol synthase domain-containing protein [Rhizobium]PYB70825.1 hypothetical protein DMY87_20415 [Rhizobium wuzhouense]RKE85306.1 hypothetical protein DFO46_2102 [Rhizobium sp. AG855]